MSLVVILAFRRRDHFAQNHILIRRINWIVALFALSQLPSLYILWGNLSGYELEIMYSAVRRILQSAVYFVVFLSIREKRTVNGMLGVIMFSTVLLALWSILEGMPQTRELGTGLTETINGLFGLRSVYSGDYRLGVFRSAAGRPISTMLGGAFAVVIPIALLTGSLTVKGRYVVLNYVVQGVIIGGLLLTYTRHAIIGISIGIFAGMSIVRGLRTKFTSLAGIALVTALAPLALFQLSPDAYELLHTRFLDMIDYKNSVNITARTSDGVERFVLDILADPRIVVWGQSSSIFDIMSQQEAFDRGLFRGFVSNSWLLTALDTGIISLLLLATLGLLVGVMLLSSSTGNRSKDETIVIGGLFAALVSSSIAYLSDNYGVVGYDWRYLFFAVLGLSVAVVRLFTQGRYSEPG